MFQIWPGMEHCTSGLKKAFPLVTDLHRTYPILGAKPLLHLICKMMDIDYCAIHPGSHQFPEDMFNQGSASDRHESLRQRICQGFQAGTESRSEYH